MGYNNAKAITHMDPRRHVMKKYIISVMICSVFLFALCGCGEAGGTPLADAYEALSAIAGADAENAEGEAGEAVELANASRMFDVQYDADKDLLFMYIDNGLELEPVFNALNESIDGKEVGTIVFYLDGTRGDDYEKELDAKIGSLSCASMERLGLNYHILDYETHKWLALAEKTNKLYIDTNCSVLAEYNEQEALSKFTDVQIAYQDPDMRLSCINVLGGAETISFVPQYVITGMDDARSVTEIIGGPAAGDDAAAAAEETTTAAETGDEVSDAAAEPIAFDYDPLRTEGVDAFAGFDGLKTVLLFPETGYTLTKGGQYFVKTLQLLNPELQINAPEEPGTENLIAASDVSAPDVTDEEVDVILSGLLKKKVESIYKECEKFKKADGGAVLKGSVLVFSADPTSDYWSEKVKYSGSGEVQITKARKEGIKVPVWVGDYQTFVYIYPTYKRTGTYNRGTGAYSQTLHVQVFDLEGRVAYAIEDVGTEPAPRSFSYFGNSAPDKHSGEVGIDKAYEYLKKLKTE